ncbi:PTS system, fructose subfamily, IIA component [Enterococcus phoeniculicola]|jgi:PTS system fructose-specific IIA component|uniref:PTS system, fructose subfamily, IIA component n=1 Tax=Enterococcus phoeniculicola ATCC BAA-412 TaxID=1158610 RepID=R3W2W0_9ENTE|nr:fructose PTS transporter subunit IIA [Enterococcus phoeniculicola]EOL41801.1 PTS system, fructose subfamily, IIA component [Enterococcus phoeniculicola ATCC BAA-412]EOT78705.1 hypothetical protein I589_00210 [Enterococcus phoeniculicola ATCC BAA-412]OJG70421.1 PTS system, fructose subfamily, IIA component [Enterococcus phoeniculicola]
MSIISIDNIKLNQEIFSQQEAFSVIAELAQTHGYSTSISEVVKGLNERELEGTTGMMDGIAIPHCQSKKITKPGVFIIRTNEGIEWQSMDGQPVRLIVSLLIPDGEAGTTHLKVLSTIARMLMKDEIKTELLQAENKEAIYTILEEHLKGA